MPQKVFFVHHCTYFDAPPINKVTYIMGIEHVYNGMGFGLPVSLGDVGKRLGINNANIMLLMVTFLISVFD